MDLEWKPDFDVNFHKKRSNGNLQITENFLWNKPLVENGNKEKSRKWPKIKSSAAYVRCNASLTSTDHSWQANQGPFQ